MLRLIQSRRLLYSLSKNNNTHSNIKKKIFFSSSVSQESILASFTAESLSLKNTSPFGSLLKFSESQSAKKMSLLRFGMKSPFVSLLKFGIFSATATAGYATYMYTTKQVEEFTKEFRLSTKKITVADDASFVEVNFL
ncbi:hypothetical protein FRX31_019144 [Thalictrum thalictroides]|uniref:Uncharacterized protein n=1 Tax=Thalictrum thalictroides TaxID=46969 RepID=A0A7J6W1K3_THATH|nr:hypothetical protein FRX31_019144 [Thalictrum thalictroides]